MTQLFQYPALFCFDLLPLFSFFAVAPTLMTKSLHIPKQDVFIKTQCLKSGYMRSQNHGQGQKIVLLTSCENAGLKEYAKPIETLYNVQIKM